MKDLKTLQNYWLLHAGHDLILCMIVRKNGSGYRGLGAKKIIQKNGENCGFLSGGCLDADIIRTAQDNWNKTPFLKSFSTMSESDRLMGYQTGCAGVIEVLFERLPAETNRIHEYLPYGREANIAGIEISLNPQNLGRRKILNEITETADDVFVDVWIEPFDLYVVGCGPDAWPFAELAPALGWNVIFLDYRLGNTLPENENIRSEILPVADIGPAIPEGLRTAVILMTHNYEADLQIISALNKKIFGYIGTIGPRKRFDHMQEDLKTIQKTPLDQNWASQIRAPAGIRHGTTSEAIAFSVIAEIQFMMNA